MFAKKSILTVAVSAGCILPFLALAAFEAFPIDYSRPLPAPTYGSDDTQISTIAINAGSIDCSVLESLTSDQKKTVMLTALFLQTRNILPKIIGPDCHFVGEVEGLAVINDALLTIDGQDEILYHNRETQLLFVSYSAKKTIAYGLPFDGEGDPIAYFLDRRTQAQTLTQSARTFDEQKSAASEAEARTTSSSRSSTTKSSKQNAPTSSEERQRIPLEERELEYAASSPPSEPAVNNAPVPTYLSSKSSQKQTAVAVDTEENIGETEQGPKPIPVIPEEPQPESTGIVGESKGSLWPWVAFAGLIVLVVVGIVLYKKKQEDMY